MGQKVSFDTKISQIQAAGRDQHNIMETNTTHTQKHQKTIKIQYSFKNPCSHTYNQKKSQRNGPQEENETTLYWIVLQYREARIVV